MHHGSLLEFPCSGATCAEFYPLPFTMQGRALKVRLEEASLRHRFSLSASLHSHTDSAAEEAAQHMGHPKTISRKAKRPKAVLRLLDLEHSKSAVLNSLGAVSSRESYGHAIDEFITWYCSEPRLSFSRTVVLRYRIHLEQRNLAPSTINVRLSAVRRLAYEAADNGLLSPELAAGIRRVKGAKRLGVRIGNWLTVEQARTLLKGAFPNDLRGKRDHAMISMLLGCGLRRAEAAGLTTRDLQIREGHWVIADLIGKGKHIRTPPVPNWAKASIDEWITASEIADGKIFRRIKQERKDLGKRNHSQDGVARR